MFARPEKVGNVQRFVGHSSQKSKVGRHFRAKELTNQQKCGKLGTEQKLVG
jgi:hypothetical protein